MDDINMKKYQEALKHLAAAQRLLEELMQERTGSNGDTTKGCDIDLIVFSILKESLAPLSARDIGQKSRLFRGLTEQHREAILKTMVSDGLIGSKKTSQTVKYFAIESAQK